MRFIDSMASIQPLDALLLVGDLCELSVGPKGLTRGFVVDLEGDPVNPKANFSRARVDYEAPQILGT